MAPSDETGANDDSGAAIHTRHDSPQRTPPITLEAGNDAGARIIADAARYQTIGSFQALALAVAAAVVTPALLGLAL